MGRFLTQEEKDTELCRLEQLYQTANERPNDGLDLPLVPYLKRLNLVDGVLTIDSCSGHPAPYDECGVLWIRLSEKKYSRFLSRVHELTDFVDDLYVKLYFARFNGEPCDIVEIRFRGLGFVDNIEPVLEHITAFFENL